MWHLLCDSLASPETALALYNRHLASQTKPDHEAERKTLTAQAARLATSEFNCRRSMLDPDLADSYLKFRDDLKMLLAQRRDVERRLDALQPARVLADWAGFVNFWDGLDLALRKATDREKQKAFLQRIVPEIRLGETLEIDLMLDLGDDPDAGTYRNCQPGLGAVRCEVVGGR